MSPLNHKYNTIIICSLEPDDETKFKRFMLVFHKTQSKKGTIGRCKTTNELQNVFF